MSGTRVALLVGALALAAATLPAHAQPATPARCARIGTDDTLRALPPAWVDAARAAFGLRDAPAALVARATVWRCADGRALACFAGANLPCGKLDTRPDLPAAQIWCGEHPGAPIPAVVTGHDSQWRWRCDGPHAVHDGEAWQPDPRGFARETWRPLPIK